jgi:serine/threonine-protein kinase
MKQEKSEPSELAAAGSETSTVAGKFQVLARLGQGGMSDVYLAVAHGPLGFNKLLVLKRLRSLEDQDQAVQMFLDEARLAARLKHPNIVDTYDVGQEGDTYFIAMEYLEGQPLSRFFKATRGMDIHPTVWLYIVAEALRGLHHAHELRDYDGSSLALVHRDISPHNIFVTYEAEVKLVDFGIAKTNRNLAQTESGFLKGKIGYMAPEQALRHEVDRRSDLFGMGVVLWEALTGRRPFEGDVDTILAKLAEARTPRLAEVRPDVDPALAGIVERALRRHPAERFATAAEMRDAILAYLERQPVVAGKPDVARTMTGLFAEHRASVQREIEKRLAKVTRKEAAETLSKSNKILIPYEGAVSIFPQAADSAQAGTSSALATASLNQAFSATPLRPPPPTGTISQRTIISILAGIAAVAAATFVLVLGYAHKSSPAVSMNHMATAVDTARVVPDPIAAPEPAPAPAPVKTTVAAPSVSRSSAGFARGSASSNRGEITRSYPSEPAPRSSRRFTSIPRVHSASPEPSLAAPAAPPPPTQTAEPVAPSAPAPGTMDSRAVAATIGAHGAEIQACLDRAHMDRPDLQGRLVIQSTIGPDGHVLAVNASNNIEGGSRLQSCVVSAWRGWTFPPPAGGVNGTFTKVLHFE